MENQDHGLSPSEAPRDRSRLIIDFWNDLRVCEELGQTSWEALEGVERKVTECLSRDPPDFEKAESLTAYAMLLIAGATEL